MNTSPRMPHVILATLSLAAHVAVFDVYAQNAQISLLRVTCEGDDVGAEVTLNGKFKGECPVDIQAGSGTVKLRVVKKIDATHERVFEREYRMGDGVVIRAEAVLSAPYLTAEGQRVETIRLQAEAARQRQEQEAASIKEVARQRELAITEPIRLEKLGRSLAELKAKGAEPGNGKSFRDCDDCPEMVLVPSGRFTMGSPPGELNRMAHEGPLHVVTIVSPFAVGKFQVTVDQFAAFVKDTGYDAVSDHHALLAECTNVIDSGKGYSWRNPGFDQGGSNPVVCVNWNDAKAYVDWLAGKTGKAYRLLTEAEWEYSARAGSTTRYFFGEDASKLDQYGIVAPSSNRKTVSVGNKRANAFGLYDVIGNVNEMVQDCYKNGYESAPADGSAVSGPDKCTRVSRNGGFITGEWSLRSASRQQSMQNSPRIFTDGLRVARTIP